MHFFKPRDGATADLKYAHKNETSSSPYIVDNQ